MKTCPYCAEQIQDQAIKCRHCGELLGSPGMPGAVPTGRPAGPLPPGSHADPAHSQTEMAALPTNPPGAAGTGAGQAQAWPSGGQALPSGPAPTYHAGPPPAIVPTYTAGPPPGTQPAFTPVASAPTGVPVATLDAGDLPEGFVLGNFQIEALVGKGGMGEVYRARHRDISRQVAVKVLARALSEHPQAMERFRREADMANSVRHDAVVKVHDFGRLPDGRYYYTMDLLRGESLSDYLYTRGRLALPDSAAILTPVIDALGAAHAAGIVHRDVKPDNIFLDTGHQGERIIRVLDFGIAKLTDPDAGAATMTQAGQILGTPIYMAPEQVDNTAADIGPHSDVYAVAAVLFHMLTGQPPIGGGSLQQIIVRKVTQEAPSILSLRPDLPPALDRVLRQALATDLATRTRDMPSLRAALVNEVPGWAEAAGPTTTGPLPVVAPAHYPTGQGAALPSSGVLPHGQTSLSGAAAEMSLPPGVITSRAPRGSGRWIAFGAAGLALVGALMVGVVLLRGKHKPPAKPTAKTPEARAPAAPPPPRRRDPWEVVPGTKGGPMVRLAGGCFQMGRTGFDPDEVPVHRVCLDAVHLDRTEVTVAHYAKCVEAGVCGSPKAFGAEEAWKKQCNWGAPGRQQHPVNCLTWYQAKQYCAWAGKRLPTEAEWEYAARGSGSGGGRMYPWGDQMPTCERVVMGNGEAEGCGKKATWAVGSKPGGATPEGILDLAGNVWEWTADCWYLKSYSDCAKGCRNPKHLCDDARTKRSIRGSSFQYGPDKMTSFRGSLRGYYKPKAGAQGVGFRCAKTAKSVGAGSNSPGSVGSGGSRALAWRTIPAGCFTQGSEEGDQDERPPHKVCLSGFKMSRTEVSVAEYEACVRTGTCRAPEAWQDDPSKYRAFCNYGAPGRSDHPVNCLTWSQAQAFCGAKGGRLPTEAEWEYAARGAEGRRYPWGAAAPSCDTAVMKDARGMGCGAGKTMPVGSKPSGASPFGVLDLAGNVWEWIHDCYDRQFYGFCGEGCRNPARGPCGTKGKHVTRGASYGHGTDNLAAFRGSFRGTWAYDGLSPRIGFRCVLPESGARSAGTPFEGARILPISRVQASSYLPKFHGFTFAPEHLFDGRLKTTWQPRGSAEDSKGQWVKIWLGAKTRVVGLSLANGFQHTKDGEDLFYTNSRLKQVTVHFSSGMHEAVTVPTDRKGFVHLKLKPRRTSWVQVTIEAIEPGQKYRDVAVSELRVWGE